MYAHKGDQRDKILNLRTGKLLVWMIVGQGPSVVAEHAIWVFLTRFSTENSGY